MSSEEYSDNIALETAVKRSNVNAVRELLEKGADALYKPRSYDSLIGLALKKKNVEIIILLIQHGAAVSKDSLESIFELKSFDDSKNVIIEIIKLNKDFQIICGVFTNLTFSKCRGPIALEILDLLFDHGLPIDDPIDFHYDTPLNYCVMGGRLDLVRLFIALGASVKKKTFGKTPLYLAACGNNEQIVRLLLKNGADVNERTENGRTALHDACLNGSLEAVTLLLKHGADVNIVDNDGLTPPITGLRIVPKTLKLSAMIVFAFLKDLAVKNFNSLPICDENLELLTEDNMQICFEKMLAELKSMKNSEVYNGLTLYDLLLLRHDCKKLFSIVKNENFIAAFESSWDRCSFKIYGSDVHAVVQDAIELKETLKFEEKKLHSVLKDFLPELVTRKLSFYANEHLFSE